MGILKDPTFWVALSLVAFFLLLGYLKIHEKLAEALDNRAGRIREELEEARRLREEAQSILAEYQRKQQDAEHEANEIIRLAKDEAEALAAETRRKLEESLERRTRLAEEKIERAEAQAHDEVRAAAIDAAISAAAQIIEKKITASTSSKLIDESIKGLKDRLN